MNENYIYGTLNELLLGLHLSLGNTFPTSYKNKSSLEIHEKLKSEIGPIEWSKLYDLTYDMSSKVKAKFIFDELMANTVDVDSIAWTSSPSTSGLESEHFKFTGVVDSNSDADIMVKTISGNYIGISAKIGVTKVSTLRTPGVSWIEARLGIEGLATPVEAHNQHMAEIGFTGTLDERKTQYKAVKGSPKAKEAERSMLEARKQICRTIHDQISAYNADNLKQFILDLISPTTIYPHYRTQTILVNESNTIHKVYNILNETTSKLNNYSDFYVHPEHNNTAYVTIYGLNKSTLSEEPIIKYSAKNKNSPMKGVDGHITSPLMSKKKKNILYAFDLDDTLFYHDFSNIHGAIIELDFWKSASVFAESCRPIQAMIDKMLELKKSGKLVEIVTARSDFDDFVLFSETMLKHGIDIQEIHVNRTGNINSGTFLNIAGTKYTVFKELINKYDLDEIHFYDDDEVNLYTFTKLTNEKEDIVLKPYLVKFNYETGKLSTKLLK